MSSYYIPEDVIFIILSWLPAKSLIRFMEVCKLWQSIISKPQFINTHAINSQKKQACVAILPDKYSNPDYIHTHEESIRLELPPQCIGMTYSFSSCNGLICLYGVSSYLWNPFTKRLKKLPTPNKKNFPKWIMSSNIGFGFDSISNDYKILRMVEFYYPLDGIGNRTVEAELYSSNADCWKEIVLPKALRSPMLHTFSKCVQLKTGVLYLDGDRELLSFDLHNEVFGVYPFPSSVHYRTKSNVLNFEDSVAMIFKSVGDASVLSLWTLDDVSGCKASWNKKFNFDANWDLHWASLMLGVGQFVGGAHIECGYFLYDYKKKDTKKLVTKEADVIVKYSESLVSLKGFEKEELSGNASLYNSSCSC